MPVNSETLEWGLGVFRSGCEERGYEVSTEAEEALRDHWSGWGPRLDAHRRFARFVKLETSHWLDVIAEQACLLAKIEQPYRPTPQRAVG